MDLNVACAACDQPRVTRHHVNPLTRTYINGASKATHHFSVNVRKNKEDEKERKRRRRDSERKQTRVEYE